MTVTPPRLWNRAPALRLLIPFSIGILCQWYGQPGLRSLLLIGAGTTGALAVFSGLSLAQRFRLAPLPGVLLHFLYAVAGAGCAWLSDPRNATTWIGAGQTNGAAIELEIAAPLVEKPASYKAEARIKQVVGKGKGVTRSGGVIIYFKKDTSVQRIHPGTRLLISAPLMPIAHTGNPGTFDFKRYSLFGGSTHQVYLTPADYVLLSQNQPSLARRSLYHSRRTVIAVLQRFIPGKKEQGLAEALLIGYKEDLDKTLVQSYANTGVVHVIAISGLHLGIIYWLLLLATRMLRGRRTAFLRLVLILAGLWAFSLLAGAQPSVLRSAVMFSAIAWSTVIRRRTSIYNSLALSALALLVWNPYWLWDAGFQLSYTAVPSIVVFYRPVYSVSAFSNPFVDHCWKLLAGSLAAQVLTFPVSIYHFHQFPLIFLAANLVAIPLSSLILLGEILLCMVALATPIATVLGALLRWLIGTMNSVVEHMDRLPFAAWSGLQLTVFQAVLLYVIVACLAGWLLENRKRLVLAALTASLLFMGLRTTSLIQAGQRREMIVYNVPRARAIDIFHGRTVLAIHDTALANPALFSFHIAPGRIERRVAQPRHVAWKSFRIGNTQVLLLDATVRLKPRAQKLPLDVLVLGRSPGITIPSLAATFSIEQVVLDSSVPSWKAKAWQRACDSLRIPCYNVAEKGAFVMKYQTPTFAHLHPKSG